jgi:hypothetical protein
MRITTIKIGVRVLEVNPRWRPTPNNDNSGNALPLRKHTASPLRTLPTQLARLSASTAITPTEYLHEPVDLAISDEEAWLAASDRGSSDENDSSDDDRGSDEPGALSESESTVCVEVGCDEEPRKFRQVWRDETLGRRRKKLRTTKEWDDDLKRCLRNSFSDVSSPSMKRSEHSESLIGWRTEYKLEYGESSDESGKRRRVGLPAGYVGPQPVDGSIPTAATLPVIKEESESEC